MMCSATQCGFRRARSKQEVREAAARRSETGPGKPYWKTPDGSTGGMAGTLGSSRRMGMGGGGVVRLGSLEIVVVVVEIVCVSWLLLPLMLYSAAVVAAPAAADAPAMRARVNLDMLAGCGIQVEGGNGRLYVPPAALLVTVERSFCCRFQTRGLEHAPANYSKLED